MRPRAAALLLLLASGCSRPATAPGIRTPPASPSTSSSPTSTPAPSQAGAPALAVTVSGVVVPVRSVNGEWAEVTTPCENRKQLKLASARSIHEAAVVLDPGHGGDERGAIGPGGLEEKEVNLEVARLAAEELGREGIAVALTRTGDYRATLDFRGAVAEAVRPSSLISIHHNSEPDGPRDRPGTESYYQFTSPASKRLAGLLYEETFRSLAQFQTRWVGDTDAGAKWRLNSQGRDYYAILRGPARAGITASLLEVAFISNPAEESLLRRDDVRRAEAQAIARAAVRFIRTNDPGSGFTEPYPRSQPAGPGGGRTGCVDPPVN